MTATAEELIAAMEALARSRGAALVALERRRQQLGRESAGEEFSKEHDALVNTESQLVKAALSYASSSSVPNGPTPVLPGPVARLAVGPVMVETV